MHNKIFSTCFLGKKYFCQQKFATPVLTAEKTFFFHQLAKACQPPESTAFDISRAAYYIVF